MSVLDRFSLKGNVALVTGSSTGLGQGMSIAFAEAGARVVGVDYVDSPETKKTIEAAGGKFHSVVANLMTLEPLQGLVDETVKVFGKIDILVNNAGIIRRADSVDFTEADWDAVIDTNLKSVFFLCQAAGRHMIAQGSGKIINIASMLTFQGGIRVASYTASKSGIGGLTKLLANEWAAKGVNVNAIAPGYIATNNTAALQADVARNTSILDRIPAARWGDPSDLGGAAVFLASSAANYVQGHILAVDGGWLAR